MEFSLCPTLPHHLKGQRPRRRRETVPPNQHNLPKSWTEIQHNDGCRYFRHAEDDVVTWVDPGDLANASVLNNVTRIIHQRLTEVNLRNDVTIVIGLTRRMRQMRTVNYYLVDRERHEVFWPEDVTYVTLGVTTCPSTNCFRILSTYQYWCHISCFPPVTVDTVSENELVCRLEFGQLPGNENMTPWTPEECEGYLADVQENRMTELGPNRMSKLGRLLSMTYEQQHDRTHLRTNVRNGRPRGRAPIAVVGRRNSDRALVQVLTSFDNPLGLVALYSVLLTGINKSLGPEGLLNDQFLLTSLAALAATLLLCFVSPSLYLFIAARVFEERFTGLVRNWMLTSILLFNAFIYGCVLSVFGSYLDPPKHQLSTPGLVMVTFVLALPPAFHVLQSSYVSE